jgi:hypothetical protein
LREALVFLLVVGGWLLYAAWALSGPLPSPLAAKMAQGRSGLFLGFWEQFWFWAGESLKRDPLWVPLLLLALPGAWRMVRRRQEPAGRACLLLLCWVALYLAGYSALQVAGYHWYGVPALLAMLVLASRALPEWRAAPPEAADGLTRPVFLRRIARVAVLLLLAAFIGGEARAI